jgi:hypothetical protein
MHGKVTTVNEWLAGVTAARPVEEARTSPVPASSGEPANTPAPGSHVLILGPGGVGKTTLGTFLSGKEDRSPFAAPPAYNESVEVDQYALKQEGGPEAMIVVPPGQEHRRVRDWEGLYKDLREGRFHGIIFLGANGYHSIGLARWKELPLAKTLKRKTPAAFMSAYLESKRVEEINVLRELSPQIQSCKTKLWLMTLVGKEDLWHTDRTKVEEHYRTGVYGALIRELEQAKGSALFKHELVLASLVISNFTSSVGETLAQNQAGYDHTLQVNSLRRLVEVFDSLRRWERDE